MGYDRTIIWCWLADDMHTKLDYFFFFQIQLIMTRLSLFLAMFATVVIAGPYSNSQQEIVTKVKNGYRIY